MRRAKSGELWWSSGTDAQIVRYTSVWERKTNRTISQVVPSNVSLRTTGAQQLHQVKRMIGGIGNMLFSTDSQNLKMGKIQGLSRTDGDFFFFSVFVLFFACVVCWREGRGEGRACVRSKRSHTTTTPQPHTHTTTTTTTTTSTNQPAAQLDSTRENSPGLDTARLDRLIALSSFSVWWCRAVLS